jgi:uncharacterized protein YqjF (DUF2071 family)
MPPHFDRGILTETAHRPWPMPSRPWLMTQTWHDLLFAHWPIDAGVLHQYVPPAFPLDQFGGQAWVGIVPFRMTNVAPRGMPAVPWLSAFPELNVRTYVTVDGKPGVYFFSLDAANPVAVRVARRFARLPYFTATMACAGEAGWIVYASARKGRTPSARFAARYRPLGPATPPSAGTLEYFLTERYRLYTAGPSGAHYSLDIHHPRWQLQVAAAEIRENTMLAAAGLPQPAGAPLLHFARRQDMVAWGLERISA